MPQRVGLRRAATGMADQGLYSATNFALTVLVARSTTPHDFGSFAIVLATYMIVVAVTRGLTSETLIVRYSVRSAGPTARGQWRVAAGAACGVGAAIGLLVGAVLVAIGLLGAGGDASRVMVCLGALLPALLVQDFYRFAALAEGRPSRALINDGVAAVVQFAASAALIAGHHASAVTLVLAWGAGAAAGGVTGFALLRVGPRVDRIGFWFRQHRALALSYATDDLVSQSSQANAYVVAAVNGLADAGALRAGQTVFNPPSIANMSVMVAVTPELVRVLGRTPARLPRLVSYIALSQCILAVAWSATALLLPARVGTALFGLTWINAHPLLVFLAIGQVGIGLRVGPMAGLRALGNGRRTLRARSYVTVLMWVSTISAAALDGARGVAIATAFANPVQAGIWWWQFRKAIRDHLTAPDADALPDADPLPTPAPSGSGRHRADVRAAEPR